MGIHNKKNLPTLEYLQSILRYEPETGFFFWKVNRGNYKNIGKKAGTLDRGYVKIIVGYNNFRAHRLAWLFYYGKWPNNLIDHINRKKNDNRIKNLRETTKAQNGWNSTFCRGKSGVRGICWHKKFNKWHVRIRANNKRIHVGYFKDFSNAIIARKKAEKKYYKQFAPKI